jgi:hypothetical protein
MIYSRTTVNFEQLNTVSPLPDKNNLSSNNVYLYDRLDLVMRKLEFNNFIDDIHWEQIRTDPTIKILIFYPDEYFNITDINVFANVIKDKKINPSQVYMITMDSNFSQFAKDAFVKNGISGVIIAHYNGLLKKINKYDSIDKPSKRFSAFSRNYNPWRLKLFLSLADQSVLNEFIYTFNNINPYPTPVKVFPHDVLHNDLIEAGFEDSENAITWLRGVPYTISDDLAKWSKTIYRGIARSQLHLLVESHFDPYLQPSYREEFSHEYSPNDYSPAFPTEKTYKAIACSRPFIAFSTPFFLEGLKQLGYKTFYPFIDESYDCIVDDNERLDAIVSEIKRLSSLPDSEFRKGIRRCRSIVEHNLQLMEQHQAEIVLPKEFNWLDGYLKIEKDRGSFS